MEIPRCISRRGSDYIVKTKQEGRLLGGDYQTVVWNTLFQPHPWTSACGTEVGCAILLMASSSRVVGSNLKVCGCSCA